MHKPVLNKRIFGNTDFEKLDYDKSYRSIIERVFERGDVEDIRQVRRYYGDEKVKERAKKKDFWDMSLLLDQFGVEKIIEFYIKKYPNNRTLISIPKCLIYFDEAEEDEDPYCLKNLTWQNVKDHIRCHVDKYLKS